MKEYKLKPLVVQFNHGFMRSRLQENNQRTFKTLGVDVISFTPNWRVVKRLMLETLIRKGDFCWHCHTGIFSYPMHLALKFNTPLVLWGEPSSEYTAYYDYRENEIEEVAETRFNRFTNLGITAEDMAGMISHDFELDPRDLAPYTFPKNRDLKRLGVRSVCLGSYIPWDVKQNTKVIMEELGAAAHVVAHVRVTPEAARRTPEADGNYVLFRANLGIALPFIKEMRARNLGQLFATLLRPYVFVVALILMSAIRTAIVVAPASILALPLYDVWVFELRPPLIAFSANLLVLGWSVGLAASGLVLRCGLGAESLSWLGVFLMAPVGGIYYPIASLPKWLQPVAWAIPASHVIGGMRSVLFDSVFRHDLLIAAIGLNIVYLGLAASFSLYTFRVARHCGLLSQQGE